jgi:hypothetical protein
MPGKSKSSLTNSLIRISPLLQRFDIRRVNFSYSSKQLTARCQETMIQRHKCSSRDCELSASQEAVNFSRNRASGQRRHSPASSVNISSLPPYLALSQFASHAIDPSVLSACLGRVMCDKTDRLGYCHGQHPPVVQSR